MVKPDFFKTIKLSKKKFFSHFTQFDETYKSLKLTYKSGKRIVSQKSIMLLGLKYPGVRFIHYLGILSCCNRTTSMEFV